MAETRDKVWFSGFAFFLVGIAALYYLLTFRVFGFTDETVALLQRIVKVAFLVVFVLGVAKVSEVYLIGELVIG